MTKKSKLEKLVRQELINLEPPKITKTLVTAICNSEIKLATINNNRSTLKDFTNSKQTTILNILSKPPTF